MTIFRSNATLLPRRTAILSKKSGGQAWRSDVGSSNALNIAQRYVCSLSYRSFVKILMMFSISAFLLVIRSETLFENSSIVNADSLRQDSSKNRTIEITKDKDLDQVLKATKKDDYKASLQDGILGTEHEDLAKEPTPKLENQSNQTIPNTQIVFTLQTSTYQQPSLRSRKDVSNHFNLYNLLQAKGSLPSQSCSNCLVRYSCTRCVTQCKGFCKHLCKTPLAPKPQRIYEYTVSNSYNGGENGKYLSQSQLIPKIVHQTWKEPITPERYPKKTLFQSSWKQKNWEYRFYTDNDAVEFIRNHFPPQVLEAYQTLQPSAFKADLFRYCVLFVNGGVYADFDVLCETDLDQVVDPTIGFFAPIDLDRCLWNGFIGSSPGHPFLAAAIETVVNYVRNRYTTVDIMNGLCRDEILEFYDTGHEDLHLSGPCLLGKVVNQVLGRSPQSKFNVHHSYESLLKAKGINGTMQLLEYQKDHFLGGERFILPSKQLIVAATTFKNGKDEIEKKSGAKHYSQLIPAKRGRVFGSFGVYTDMNSFNEDVKFVQATISKSH